MSAEVFLKRVESRAYVIAEIGVNHNGQEETAERLVQAASASGADAVKFQTFRAELLASHTTPKVAYQVRTSGAGNQLEMLKKLELAIDVQYRMFKLAKDLGLDFISTPYDLESVDELDELGVDAFKSASADIVDLPLQARIAATGRPVLLSTGMANLGEIERAVALYRKIGPPRLVLLQCVSNYPCSDESVNLRTMQTLSTAFSAPCGYSDHTVGNEAAIAAIALGARVIERHFTLDRMQDGPDHRASIEPGEFRSMVESIRRTEVMLGSTVKTRQPEEEEMAIASRKSVHLLHAVDEGELLTAENLTLRRPGTGLTSEFLLNLIGRRARRPMPAGYQPGFRDIE